MCDWVLHALLTMVIKRLKVKPSSRRVLDSIFAGIYVLVKSPSNKVTSLRHISFKCLWKFTRFVGYLPTNCLIVFDHFLELTLKELKWFGSYPNLIHAIIFYIKPCPRWGFTFYHGVMVKLRIMVFRKYGFVWPAAVNSMNVTKTCVKFFRYRRGIWKNFSMEFAKFGNSGIGWRIIMNHF